MHSVVTANRSAEARYIVAVADLLPTQFTVGLLEVSVKRERWRERNYDDSVRYLSNHRVPVVLGPENRKYIIDRHHLTRALYDEGMTVLPVTVVAEMNALSHAEFWFELENRGWTHPFDDTGRRRAFRDIPTSVCDLIDDPYRSLAGALKRAGGYTKDKAPFSEFRWADFLRCQITREIVEYDFDRALALATELALSREAIGMPGWRGASLHH